MICEAEALRHELREFRHGMFARLAAIEQRLFKLQGKVSDMTQATDSLQAAVERETEVEKSAVILIQGLADQVRQTSTDPQVQALADRINANAGALAAAVANNTPAVQPTPPEPAPAPAQPAPASSDL